MSELTKKIKINNRWMIACLLTFALSASSGFLVSCGSTPEEGANEDIEHAESAESAESLPESALPPPTDEASAQAPVESSPEPVAESPAPSQPAPQEASHETAGPSGGAWNPSAYEKKRFLDRSTVSPSQILQGEFVFAKDGDDFSSMISEISSQNTHLAGVSRVVSGDHFLRPSAMPAKHFDKGIHTIRRGDTLMKISSEVYGTPSRWVELFFLNTQIEDFDRIEVGDSIVYAKESSTSHFAATTDAPSPPPTHPDAHSAPTDVAAPTQVETPAPAINEASPLLDSQVGAPVVEAVPAPAPEIAPPPPMPTEAIQAKPVAAQEASSFSAYAPMLIRGGIAIAFLGILGYGAWLWVSMKQKRRRNAFGSLTEEMPTYSDSVNTQEQVAGSDFSTTLQAEAQSEFAHEDINTHPSENS